MVGHPSPADFKKMINGNLIYNWTVTIKDIDDRKDLDEDDEIRSLEAGEEDAVNFDFQIPLEADDERYCNHSSGS